MQTSVLEAIDEEILRLQQVRALLGGKREQTGKRRGRPKGSTNKSNGTAVLPALKPTKRTMSDEVKARMSVAQKARWAAQKKAE